ncbi:hypothetical protein CSH63_33180 [Micromonospora tulbaghiae]|uniref:SPW repeat-containing protein n=1 Tax=Micromonospora tulbaghiae TaxID=479978 RepID=A0A386WYR0_9ACTN|nr:hypothetical protein [Micromonospora tulbaghiae]AYF30600.1 hypothetical protein CSH63_24780 [Micromonospora tulbaghiae]AYF32209.1 hypothetical protein CSH63_33180 [Micromonospora tulbaghiae]
MVARPRRWSRVFGYVAVAAAGIGAAIVPDPRVVEVTGQWVYLWAGFLIAGGISAAVGSLTDRWLGEALGCPLLATSLAAYAVVLAATRQPPLVIGGLFLAGMALLMWARSRDIELLRREATRAAHIRNGGSR